MQIKRIILLLVLALSTTLCLNAQSRVEQRAKNRANQNVDREIDKAVDKTFDKVGDIFKKKKKKKKEADLETVEEEEVMTEEEIERQRQEMITRMMGGGSSEDWEPIKNEFQISFDAEIKNLTKGKEEIMHATYTFDTWKTGMTLKTENEEEMRMILDNQEGSMTTIMEQDGKKQGYKMRQQVVNMADNVTDDDIKITKTSETKTINGYFCTKYIVEMDHGTSSAWITQDIKLDFNMLMQSMRVKQQKKQKSGGINLSAYQGLEGMPIQTTYVSKNNKETSIVTMSNIKTGDKINRKTLDTSGVEIMSMGF
ncbi:MAG: hypothetical protein DHS20C18_27060 [Saprospiraceae bacterium]|nr:MAG: hypothetical protein DHS20C18_27060 [Saprospiraceae bacterium]